MRARLFCKTGPLRGAEYPIEGEASVGRAAGNTIVLDTTVVSKAHSRIFCDEQGGEYWLEDLSSRNGTRLDGLPVTEPTRLGALHVVTFAEEHDFILQRLPDAAADASRAAESAVKEQSQTPTGATVYEPAPVVAAPPIFTSADGAPPEGPSAPGTLHQIPASFELPPALARSTSAPGTAPSPAERPQPAVGDSADLFDLEVEDASHERTVFPLRPGRNVVGRAAASDIHIDDVTLSREHAALEVTGSAVTVTDLDSRNGTCVDGRQISTRTSVTPDVVLTFGDQVKAHLIRRGR